MSQYFEWLKNRYETSQEKTEKKREVDKRDFGDAAQRLLQRATGREPNDQDKALVTSMTDRAVDGPETNRTRMPVPPKGLNWGSKNITTDRDAHHCICGRLKSAHTDGSLADVCERWYPTPE